MKPKSIAQFAGLALACFTSTHLAQAAEVNVMPSNIAGSGWHTSNSGTASGAFIIGPATPDCGDGSYQLSIGADGDSAAQIRNRTYNGILLADIVELSYSTYVTQDGSGGQAPYIILNIDLDGNGTTDDQLFFEPAYQTGIFSGDPIVPQPALQVGVWQNWNARAGAWWALSAGTFGPPLVTLDTYIAAHPTARLAAPAPNPPAILPTGSLRIVTGFGAPAWNNFIGSADCVAVNGTTYDFDPDPDADGDGVIDADDHCPLSDLTPKVDVGNGPTSIDNTVDDDGCSIQDLVNACATDAKNHGKYVSCVTKLANDLRKAGVITNSQSTEMKNGAAKSSIGK
jgi:hypothetical protein